MVVIFTAYQTSVVKCQNIIYEKPLKIWVYGLHLNFKLDYICIVGWAENEKLKMLYIALKCSPKTMESNMFNSHFRYAIFNNEAK